jgi:RNA polymerase sigma factor (sigma-70 family)
LFCIYIGIVLKFPLLQITEAEIIEGCKAAKRDLQKALYQRFSGKMFAVCLRYSKSREEAEDILQDAFIKVYSNINQYIATGSFEGWIRRIMVNTALEALRKKKIDYSEVEIQDLEDSIENVHDVMSKIGMNDLLTFIQQLPAGYRAVFNLYAIEGYQHKEIAGMLNISEGTSRSQLARARQLLQEKIKHSQQVAKPIELKYSIPAHE